MKERARVVKKESGQSLVKVIKTSACSHCDKKCMLAQDSHEVEEMEVLVNDPIGAEVGSLVELEMASKPVLFSAFVVYLLPLVAIIAGYFVGNILFNSVVANAEVAGIIGSVIAFLLSFLMLRFFDHQAGARSYFHPEITRVVSNNGFYYED